MELIAMVTVSVIICTYNRAATLKKTIDSLMNQENIGKKIWELLVIDNNSDDDTREVISDFAAKDKLNIHYVFEPQQGKTYALNTGITKAKGQVLAFTDDDVIVDSKWLASIIDTTTKYPHHCFGGKVIPLWPGPIPEWIQSAEWLKVLGGPITSHGLKQGNEIREYGESMWVPIGANMFFRRAIFDKYGKFRTDLGPKGNIYGTFEDCEFCFRLKHMGEKLLYCPNAIIYHPVAKSKLSKKYFLNYFWGVGLTQSRVEGYPSKVTIRYLKTILKLTLLLLKRIAVYMLSALKNKPATIFYHQCQFYCLSAQLYQYIKRNTSV